MNMSNKNIFQRVAAITAELGAIAKDLTVGEGDKAYSATSEATILAAVKPLEEKHGVFSYAVSRTLDQKIVEKPYMWNGEQRLVRLVMATVTEVYRFVNVAEPTDCLETVSFGTGMDSGDKAPGKAMTYADKYALMKTYKISTGIANDPDSIPSPDEGVAFVETNPLIPSSKNNPMIPATSPAASTPVTQPTQAPAKAAANMQMSLDAARQVIVPFGNYAKKTLGELMTIDRSLVEFYASDRFSRRDTYTQLHEAAQVITQSKAG